MNARSRLILATKHTQRSLPYSFFQNMRANSTNAKPMFEGQATLPHLPVPPLEQTLTRYLRSTLPLQTPESLKVTENAVASARNGSDAKLMQALQKRLEHRATAEGRENWLSDWWLSAAYMSYRDPVVPFSSYFYLHKSDPTVKTGAARGAQLLKSMLAFRAMIVNQTLAPETSKTGYMCMAPYKWMFNTSRVPVPNEDVSVAFEPAQNNHVIVVRNGHIFSVDLVNPHTGKELCADEIELQLQRIIEDPRTQVPSSAPIGALTSANRDVWTKNREDLLAGSHGEHNRRLLERIESAIIVLALDHGSPVTFYERARDVYSGPGSNRFYDKQQFVVSDNGVSGFIGEHSMMDGSQTLRMNNFVLSALAAGKIELKGPTSGSVLDTPTALEFRLEGPLAQAPAAASNDFINLMEQQDLSVLDFTGYGKEEIKQYNSSPDAWAQMCIQLAYYKLYGQACATYESAQTRKFKLGRTETIRSASPESLAFTQAMCDPSVSDEERYRKYQAAAMQHVAYAKAAAEGQGVDRHMFGLKRMLRDGEELPAVFKDPMNATSGTWILSTSQISSKVFDAWGFGEVTPKGFGIAYAIKDHALTFTVMCLKQSHSASRFTHFLNEAVIELRGMHDRLATKPKL